MVSLDAAAKHDTQNIQLIILKVWPFPKPEELGLISLALETVSLDDKRA